MPRKLIRVSTGEGTTETLACRTERCESMLTGTAMAMSSRGGSGSSASTTRSFFRVSSELLKNAPSHQTFRCVELKHSSRDFTNLVERFDGSAIQPEMVVPQVQPGIEQWD